MSKNLSTVQAIYEAFGKGDIPAIMDKLADDARWDHQGNAAVVPFAGTFTGNAEIQQFFQKLGQSAQFSVFQPKNFREEPGRVVNDVYMEATALPTGKSFHSTVTFYWTFNGDGAVTYWKNEGGLEALEAAYR